MKPMLFALAATITAFLALTTAEGGGKGDAFAQTNLPADAYKALTERSIKAIEALASSDLKDASERIEVEAGILVGYTLSVKNPGDAEVGKMRGAAIKAVQAARNGERKKLVEFGKSIGAAPAESGEKLARKAYLQDLTWMMEVFKGKNKGGEGLHTDLHYHPKLKNLNGIEALIGALGSKKLSDENVDKVAKELPLLAYRVAVIGSITHEFPPDKRAGEWRSISEKMRSSAVELAESAAKKNADGILKAAAALDGTCTQCHREFKGKL
jgi:hypothetical protein